jgi:hypothetical protein
MMPGRITCIGRHRIKRHSSESTFSSRISNAMVFNPVSESRKLLKAISRVNSAAVLMKRIDLFIT